jgi:1,4-alpha-glucan branching enzyme
MNQGLGAYQNADGNWQFSVWAPHAEHVSVVGSFNNWDASVHPMQKNEAGIWSTQIQKAKAGDQYKYQIVNQGHVYTRNDPYASKVTNSNGNSVLCKPPKASTNISFHAADLNRLVIYELHIGTFGRHKRPCNSPATFKNSIPYLDELRELGINAIEIMPIHEFAGGISWGYNPSNLFAVESDYGSAQDFYDFVQAAHERGIAVILDVVYNHFGPSDLDLWQFDGWSENGKGGIYFYNDWRASTPWGDTRPDYGRPEVRQFIIDNALMWAREYNIDGLRLDMCVYIRTVHGMPYDEGNALSDGWSLMQAINKAVHQHNPRFITISEDMQDSEWLTKNDIEAGGAGFNAQWGAFFVHTLRDALLEMYDSNRNMHLLSNALTQCFNGDAFERVIYTESHDEVANGQARIPEDASPGNADSWIGKRKSILGAGIIFTAPGIPMIFQGQEFLEDQWFQDTRPLDWSKLEKHEGIWLAYRDLISLRLNKTHRTSGLCSQHIQVFNIDEDNKVIAFQRWEQGGIHDTVVVVANFSNRTLPVYDIGLPNAGEWHVVFNSNSREYDPSFDDFGTAVLHTQHEGLDDLPYKGTVALAPYSLLILCYNG